MKNSHSIAILLATYNGGRFLREQLDSLFAQTCQDWELFVHDDCSQDDTVPIIEEYQSRFHGRIHLLEDQITKGRGAKDSFMWLLDHVESRYYAFCDQDDIWLPQKLQLTFERMIQVEKKSPAVPLMVYTDLTIADSECKPIASYWKSSKMDDVWFDSFDSYIAQFGRCMGCTSLINQRVKEVAIPMNEKVWGHDYWLALKTCACGGKCVSIPVETILYRQHGSNTSGGAPVYDSRWWFVRKLKRVDSIIAQYRNQYAFIKEVADVPLRRFLASKIHILMYRFTHS